MSGIKEKLLETLKGSKIAIITIETANKRVSHVCFDEAVVGVRKKAQKALEAGHSVTWEDGRTQWIDVEPLFNSKPSGGFYWHKDGNRVKCEKRLYTRAKDGKVTTEVLKTMWVDYKRVMEV